MANVRDLLRERKQSCGTVVLAGGLARRLGGQDKGLVQLAGQPMIHYALDTVLPLFDLCVINANRNQDNYQSIADRHVMLLRNEHPSLLAVQVVPDSWEGHLGPLAGLSSAIDALKTDYVFMCPCDSPFIQAELVTSLLSACVLADADIAVAHDGERLQPVFCVVNSRVKSSLDTFLSSGERKIDRWFQQFNMLEVDVQKQASSFVNINTEQERAKAEQILLS